MNKKLFAFQKHIRQVNLISFFPPNFFIHGYFRVASLGEEPILHIWFSYNSRLCEYHYNHQPTILDVQLQPKAYLNKNQIKERMPYETDVALKAKSGLGVDWDWVLGNNGEI